MCQLLGMNCNVPTDIVFSFTGFHHRGGRTDQHVDGWGIAFYEDRGCRLFIDTTAAAQSPIAQLVRSYPIRSLNVIAHIRKATVGPTALENTHPFLREMWGRYWTFAHNGTLKGFVAPGNGDRRYTAVGTTDSEAAFCYLLETLRIAFPGGCTEDAALFARVGELARELREYGEFNFLLCDGERLFAHCATRLSYIVRKAPFSRAHLVDEDYDVDFSLVTTPNDRVAVVATVPLTDNETWTVIEPGTLVMFRDGAPFEASAQWPGSDRTSSPPSA
jgi:predicted glutamine amidotransferase